MGQFRSERDGIDYKQTVGGLKDIIYSLPLPQFLPKHPVAKKYDEDAWQEDTDSGLYIVLHSLPPGGGGGNNQRVWRWGKKSKGEKEKKRKFGENLTFSSTTS